MHTMGNRSLSVHQMYLTTTLRTVRRYSYKSRTGWITVTVNPEYVPDDSYRGDLIVVSPVSNTGIALHEVFRVLIENCNNRYVSSSSATNSAICLTCLGINCKCIRCFAQTALHFRILKLWKTLLNTASSTVLPSSGFLSHFPLRGCMRVTRCRFCKLRLCKLATIRILQTSSLLLLRQHTTAYSTSLIYVA